MSTLVYDLKACVRALLVIAQSPAHHQRFWCGVPADVLQRFKRDGTSGVGLAGMRERVRELGGEFHIDSGTNGTTVRVSLPIAIESFAADSNAAD